MPVADEVIVKLEADIAEYKRKLAEAETAMASMTKKVDGHVVRMSTGISKAGLIMGTAIGSFAGTILAQLPGMFINAAKAAFEYASSVGEIATQVGVTTDTLQEYRHIGEQVNIENDEMDKGLQMLNLRFGMAEKGAKPVIKALADLGFNAKETAGLIKMEAGDALPLLAEAFKNLKTEQDRARVAGALFGRGMGQKFKTLMDLGAEGINNFREEAHKLGVVLDEETIQSSDEAADKLKSLQRVLMVQMASIIGQNAQSIVDLATALAGLVVSIGKTIPWLKNLWQNFKITAMEAQNFQLRKTESGILGTLGIGSKGRQETIALNEAEIKKIRDQNLQDAINKVMAKTSPEWAPKKKPAAIDLTQDTSVIDKALAGKEAKQKKDDAREKAEAAARAAAEQLRQFMDDSARAEGELLNITAQIIGTREAHQEAELRNIDIEEQIALRAIAAEQKEDAVDKAIFDQMQAQRALEERKVAQAKRNLVLAEKEEALRADAIKFRQTGLDNDIDLLRAQLDLVTSREERAKIEARLVDLAYEQERIALRAISQNPRADPTDRDIAQRRYNMLDELQASQKAAAERDSASPGTKYIEELRVGLEGVNDTLENLAVDKIRDLEDALAASVAKTLGLKGALGEIVTELIRVGVQMMIIKPLADALFGSGGFGSGGGGGWLGGLLSAFGLGKGATGGGGGAFTTDPLAVLFGGHQGGGRMRRGETSIVGERGPELFTAGENGTITPNHQLMRGGGGGPPVVHIAVGSGEYFDARVAKVSGAVSTEVVKANVPAIIQTAAAHTRASLTRRKM